MIKHVDISVPTDSSLESELIDNSSTKINLLGYNVSLLSVSINGVPFFDWKQQAHRGREIRRQHAYNTSFAGRFHALGQSLRKAFSLEIAAGTAFIIFAGIILAVMILITVRLNRVERTVYIESNHVDYHEHLHTHSLTNCLNPQTWVEAIEQFGHFSYDTKRLLDSDSDIDWEDDAANERP